MAEEKFKEARKTHGDESILLWGSREKDISVSFVYYAIREKVAALQRGGLGSVFNTITRDTLKQSKLHLATRS